MFGDVDVFSDDFKWGHRVQTSANEPDSEVEQTSKNEELKSAEEEEESEESESERLEFNKNEKNISKMASNEACNIVDNIISQQFIQWTIRFILIVYGSIGSLSLLLLIFYSLDYFITFWYSEYSSFDYVFLYSLIGLCSIGALIGMYGTCVFGQILHQIQSISTSNENLKKYAQSASNHTSVIEKSRDMFQFRIDSILESDQYLKAQIASFRELEKCLKSITSKSNNSKIIALQNHTQILLRQLKQLKMEIERTKVLNLFCSLQFGDDDDEGLNEYEYKVFINRLDDEIKSKFKLKTFKDMDHNGDGTIDLAEFQAELDKIYNRMPGKQATLTGDNERGKRLIEWM